MRWVPKVTGPFEGGVVWRLRETSDFGMRVPSAPQSGLPRILSVSIRGRKFELSLWPDPRAAEIQQASRREDPRPVNFWNSLTPAERQAFEAVAQERVFARGARLMQEGEQANYVMVIRSGWTRITVSGEHGERIIAERGPGQLVGERGALRLNLRSATVIALDTVRALAMKTEDFASFIGSHPRVLDIVESQIYDRLTEEQAGRVAESRPATPQVEPVAHPAADGPHRRELAGENCTVLLTDVVGFGGLHRDDGDRLIIRQAILDMTRTSLGKLWEQCHTEDRGDGLLIVAPPMILTAQLMERLHRQLPPALKRHNHIYGESVRIQLRIAVNVGPVTTDSFGMSGEAIIRTARLLEAPALKEAMASTRASLGIIASDFVYETAIRHTVDGWMDSHQYDAVRVRVKESDTPAWMQLIDQPSPERRLRDPLSRVRIPITSVSVIAAGSLLPPRPCCAGGVR